MVHGLPVVGLQSIVPVGKTVPPPTLSQFSCEPGKIINPVVMLPVPGVTPTPPVGMVAKPRVLFSARNDSQLRVSQMIPAPPRRTVLLFPNTSQANPARG